MGQEITITFKIATTAEADVVSAIQTAGKEDHVPEVPSVQAHTGMGGEDIFEPPAYEQLDEAVESTEPPSLEVENPYGLNDGDIPEVPGLDELEGTNEGSLPVPEDNQGAPFEGLEDLVDADVPPTPDVGHEAALAEQQDSTEVDVPPIPSV